MKKRLYRSALTALVVSFLLVGFKAKNAVPGNGNPCDSEAFLNKCAPSLEDFVFITTFKVYSEKQGDKTNYSYVLSRGTNYKIVICDQNEEGNRMIVNFYDRSKKLIASNYLKSSKKFFPSINFPCQVTGVYYVEVYFEGEKKGCGLNILGFKKG